MTHTMLMVSTHPDGRTEWQCPDCGRRILMKPWPATGWTVLDEGTEPMASHKWSIGGLTLDARVSDPTLDPWREWLDGRGEGERLE